MLKSIVVIGLGSMGKRRIRLLKAMKLSVEVVGIDSNVERCKTAEEQFRIESYSSLEEAEEQVKIDCAFICTPPLSHARVIQQCLAHGYHIFTEINLVADLYKENVALAHEKGLTLFLSSTPIYRDEMKIIGEQVRVNGHKVSYLYHVGQYLPDWHPWERYESFFASSRRSNGCRELFAIELPWMVKVFGEIVEVHVLSGKMSELNIDFQDTYFVQLLHANGSKGVFAVDVVCRKPVRKLEVYNEELYIEWEGTPQTLKKQNLVTGKSECIGGGSYIKEEGYSEFVNEYAYINEIREFFEVINGKDPEYTMEMDAQILDIIDQIEKATQENKK